MDFSRRRTRPSAAGREGAERLIVFAHPDEAEAALTRVNATPWDEGLYPVRVINGIPACYRFDAGWIVITGMGCAAAQLAVHQLLLQYGSTLTTVWNLGFAGDLHGALQEGAIYEIGSITKHLPKKPTDPMGCELTKTLFPEVILPTKGYRLLSSDLPLYDQGEGYRPLAHSSDLVDMEGYGVAYAAHRLGKACALWKIVSDAATPEGRERMQAQKKHLAYSLAEFLYTNLLSGGI